MSDAGLVLARCHQSPIPINTKKDTPNAIAVEAERFALLISLGTPNEHH